jgi:hypothetical protein
MRHGLLHRGALIAAVAVAVAATFAAPWASPAAADVAQVTVVSPGGGEQTLAFDAMAGSEDISGRAYVLRSDSGEATQTVTGFSLAQLIDAAGADPYGFSYLEVQRPAGGTVLLSRDQALDNGAFADGPPVVYATAGGTGFLRPSAGAGDLNASDSFDAPQGVRLVLRKGMALRVRAEASTVKTVPGKKVEFSAIVERAGSGEQLTYSWNFDDGHSGSGSEASHSFAKRGSYDVVVGVTSSGNEAGASDVITVQVGEPLGGPDRKGGGTDRKADAPDHGSAEGPSSGSEGGSGSGTTPSASSGEETDPSTAATAERRAAAKPKRQPSGEQVSGELLDATAKSAEPRQQAAARTGNLDGGGEGGPGLSATAAGALGTIGLLGLGALLEAGGLARLRPRGGIA